MFFQFIHFELYFNFPLSQISHGFLRNLLTYPLLFHLYFQKLIRLHSYFLALILAFRFGFFILIIFIVTLFSVNQEHLFHLFGFFKFLFFQFNHFLSLLISSHAH